MIKQNQKHLNRIFVILDAALVALAFISAWYIRFASGVFQSLDHLTLKNYSIPIIIVVPLFVMLNYMFGLYAQQRYKYFFSEAINILKVNGIAALLFVATLFMYKEVHYSRAFIVLFFIANILYAVIMRLLVRLFLRNIRKKGMNLKHCIMVGTSGVGEAFLARIRANRHWGYSVMGVLTDELPTGSMFCSVKVLGSLSDLNNLIVSEGIDEVFLTIGLKDYDKLGSLITACEKEGVKAQIIPDYLRYIPAKPYVEDLDGLPVINIRHVPLDDMAKRILKRIFDIVFSAVAILLISPILLLCAVMVKVTSPGPILFKQERVGLNRKPFAMYKFRSMRVENPSVEKVKWTTKDDPRKTKWGTFMRKTSLDELPQFFNVLMGDMSVVGPRPERPYFVDKFKEDIPKYMIKHQVRPGITGWAQIHGWRGDTSIEKRIEFDLYYIENWSMAMDIKIVLLTVFKGFVNKNAY